MLAIDSARKYGFIKGGPRCNMERCEQLLELGADRGFTPSKDAVVLTVRAFVAEPGEHGRV